MRKKKCTVEFTELAYNDLSELSEDALAEFWIVISKLEKNINTGIELKNNGIRDLSDCLKLYFHNAEYRIIYLKKNEHYEIQGIRIAEIVGIGRRKDYMIYDEVAKRLNRFLNNNVDGNELLADE